MNNELYLFGLNYRTAEVEVREKFLLISVLDFDEGLLAALPAARESMALSTCNRVEIVVVGEPGRGLADSVLEYWAARCGGPVEKLRPHVYLHRGLDAVRHLFRVGASLDSMVMGEPQILGQLKDAYRRSVESHTAKVVINRLLHRAFFTAKRVRTETGIGSSAVSISYAAVALARKIFGELTGCRAMLVGAGEMAELAARHLLGSGVEKLLIANRTLSRAEELAWAMGGEAIPFDRLSAALEEVDIVISSTGAPHVIIKARDLKAVLKRRRNRPMFFIDIAVPRDIDPDVNSLDNTYLYDIDDLQEVVEENKAQRQDESVKAEDIVSEETEAFGHWLDSLALQPTIVDLYERASAAARQEVQKTLKRLGTDDPATAEALEKMALAVGKKLLHEPIAFLKRRTREEGSADRFIDLARRMFNLDHDLIPDDAHADRRRESDDTDQDEEETACAPTSSKT